MSHYDDLRGAHTSAAEHLANPSLVATAINLLIAEESFESAPYLCSEGFPTVGFGQRIGPQHADIALYQFKLPKGAALKWLEINVALLVGQVATNPKTAAAFANCNLARQTVLISMAYQMGLKGLAGFTHTLAALADGRWEDAWLHALDSRWAIQTPKRAQRHADVLATGEW
ncbi:glycoside hydrolase family protein [Shewanella sp. AS1]|uniref:glycoside hydrolase family protein n=1 Tax=Shewanella sp. AS1 TaxID=2907626 RepID=UPI001F29FA77|nr:glycoside hydrolase family protein [Shewanella sp. AS1]MCE9679598.1 glycoside hydrolase family protein [Shewanella sp. AS1]